ncbi:D-sedoheptulose 7-phosphate isomerase [candidate division KSB1 bacterium]|nr:D-sedoheptulose 7-phosphate isomerase [candidate division KSB1 bacterium]
MQDQLRDSARIKDVIRENFSNEILTTANQMINCFKNGGKLLICGNGGSAADAQHFAAEMVGRLNYDRGALAAVALTTDSSILTAVSNDYSFDHFFARQVEALGNRGDTLIALSTSGHSQNVLNAVYAAKEKKIQTIALSGKDGGALAELADYNITIPSHNSQRIQEGHITIIHIWCNLIEKTLFPVK